MDALAARLIPQPGAPRPVLLGYSGGLDSTVLLHLLAGVPALHGGLRAIHVDHGLHRDSAHWAAHCRAACKALGVPLQIEQVRVHEDGRGLEAAARTARHAAFAQALRDGEVLALAHHADDQAETFLLHALRASGPDGLAAMQPWRAHGNGGLWRPLLGVDHEALQAHASAQGLQWLEDPANADPRFDRNFLRARVLPVLRERWPHAAAAFARSAALCADAAALLREEDARALAAVHGADASTLDVPALLEHSRERRARILRRWVASLGLPPLPAQGIERVESDLLQAAADGEAAFAWSGSRLRRWRHWLHAGAETAPLPTGWETAWDGAAVLVLPGGGSLRLHGVDRFHTPLRVHARQGGERIRLPGRAHRHALKHVLQDRGVPPWERERLPLLSGSDGELLAAGDRIIAASLQAWLGEHGARLTWHPPGAVAASTASTS